MNILYHYLREGDVIAALSNRTLGNGPLLSVIKYLEEYKIDLVRCTLLNDKRYFENVYLKTINNALYRNESELYSQLKDKLEINLKNFIFSISYFLDANIKNKFELILLENPDNGEEFHPNFYNEINNISRENVVFAIHDTTGAVTSDFFIYELNDNKNIKVVVNKTNFPNGVSKDDVLLHDILGTNALSTQSFLKNVLLSRSDIEIPETFDKLITSDPEMKSIIKIASFIAKYDDNILLLGDTGTGKEVMAKAIHNASNRKDKPFISVNCAAIPRELFESEMFGSVPGGYHNSQNKPGFFEEANGGTLFLDEIGDTFIEHQTKMLRVLQEKEISRVGSTKKIKLNFRLICATNKTLVNNLDISFRSDLYYRINEISLKLPALKDRHVDDIRLLLEHFLKSAKSDMPGFDDIIFTDSAISSLEKYSWPGNIRELKGIVRRAYVWAAYEGKNIDVEIMKKCFEIAASEEQNTNTISNMTCVVEDENDIKRKYKGLFNVNFFEGFNLEEFLAVVKEEYIKEAINICRTKTQAAKLTGYSQPTFSRLSKGF